jgi:hypothetical protein
MADGRWQMADGSGQMAVGSWQMAENSQFQITTCLNRFF